MIVVWQFKVLQRIREEKEDKTVDASKSALYFPLIHFVKDRLKRRRYRNKGYKDL